jgi:chemotaxis protein CheD
MKTSLSPHIRRIFLKPGELCVASEPTLISTVLGSCISVTMFSRRFKTGAMCHALLPKKSDPSGPDAFRFVDHAILHMIREFRRIGVRQGDIEVKLFGGSDVLPSDKRKATVGDQNVQRAFEIIEREGLTLIAEDVRGERGRKIFFNTSTGEILLKRIKRSIQ